MAPRGWWHIAAKLLQCLQFPAWQPLSPAWGRLFYSSLSGNICQCPAWARLQSLPLPCLGTLASVHALPGHHQGLQSLPGTLAGSLLWNACQFLPGNVCQCPAWARFAVPAWDALPVPCLGINVCQCPAWACLPVPAWECFSVAVHVLNKKSY